jgi:hypothetical protein
MNPERVAVVVTRHLSGSEEPVGGYIITPEEVERAKKMAGR